MQHNQLKTKKYQLGLALSGGGARGFAHIGVLKALEENGIFPDLIAGVSAGSIIGSLYCAGYSPDEMLALFKNQQFKDMAELNMPRISLFEFDGFKKFMRHALKRHKFEELERPLKVIVTDIDNGVSVTLDSGNVAQAVFASCSIPVIFPPMLIDGTNYVDGGLLRNFPVTPIRSLCDYVIGIDVNPISNTHYKKNLLGMAQRSYSLMFRANATNDRKLCDLLIDIHAANDYNIFDMAHVNELVAYGYHAAIAKLDEAKEAGFYPPTVHPKAVSIPTNNIE